MEGPIKEIAAYPAYAPTNIVVDEGGGGGPATHRMIYWGGPASGLNYTTSKVPGCVARGSPAGHVQRNGTARALSSSASAPCGPLERSRVRRPGCRTCSVSPRRHPLCGNSLLDRIVRATARACGGLQGHSNTYVMPPPPLVDSHVLASFADVAGGTIPAMATYGSLLFNSPHPEAVEGVGLACDPPLPPGCITADDRLANWQLLARRINAHIGTAFVVPAELGVHR